jgi:hypothetical protein
MASIFFKNSVLFLIFIAKPAYAHNPSAFHAALMAMPLSFEENRGQTDPAVHFLSRNRGFSLFLTDSEAVVAFKDASQGTSEFKKSMPFFRSNGPGYESAKKKRGPMLRMKWKGCQPGVKSSGLDPLPGRSNYFRGNKPEKWVRNVRQYGGALLRGIYPGIDLAYYGNNGMLEFDWEVHPGAQPAQIELELEGAEGRRIDEMGNLSIEMPGGRALLLKAPLAYQQKGGSRAGVKAAYALSGKNGVKLTLGYFDPSEKLIIDPVLLYSSFLGGDVADSGECIAVDGGGNSYVSGQTTSDDFPVSGLFVLNNTFDQDAFITKINAAGSAIIYSTYLGGSGEEVFGGNVAVDVAGNAYIAGLTMSTDFPVLNAFQGALAGPFGDMDAFVTKINSSGNAIVYSSYLGGSGYDFANAIAVDLSGSAYVTGATLSPDFPVALPLQANQSSANKWDAFVTKFSPSGTALTHSTFLGGSESDTGLSIAVDVSGNAYVSGITQSPNFPVFNAWQSTYGGDSGAGLNPGDAFVAKLNSGGASLAYATFLGGSGDEQGNSVAIDALGNAYVAGYTNSSNYPLANPFQPAFGGGSFDAFVSKLGPAGSTLLYSTYLGGAAADRAFGIAIDSAGNAIVVGATASSDFPVVNAFQTALAGIRDAFVCKLGMAGNSQIYSTFLGGSGGDDAYSVALDGAGGTYLAGKAGSADFPVLGAFQSVFAGDAFSSSPTDAFVAKIAAFNPTATPTPSLTRSATPVPSVTTSASPSLTPTVTPSRTRTPGFSASPSPSPSPSPSMTPTSSAGPSTATSATPSAPAPLSGAIYSYPNPVLPGQIVTFIFAPSARASLKIYDWSGRKILELPETSVQAFKGSARWDGRDLDGHDFASGAYFVVLKSDAGSLSGKFSVLRP